MKNVTKIMAVFLLMLSGHVSAATITWASPVTNVNTNDTFTIDIIGTGFTSTVDGGGVNFSYNSNVLNVLSVSVDTNVWDLGVGISAGAIDNAAGAVNGVMVNTWSGVTGGFSVASVTFQAVASGTTGLSLSEYILNPWAGAGLLLNPDYVDATVTVSAVPVPAAVWLFGSGLMGLMGFARRKTV